MALMMRSVGSQGRSKSRAAISLFLLLLGCSFSVQSASAKLRTLSKLVVLGDSYSDAGNSGLITQSSFPPGFPFPAYADGRFSNGPVAMEQLWSLFNPSLPPLKPSLAGGTNYAVGGATSGLESYMQAVAPAPGPGGLYAGTSANAQKTDILSAFPSGTFDPNTTLFAFWVGPNDAAYWLQTGGNAGGKTPGTINAGLPVPATAEQLLANALTNISIGLQALIDNGAQHLLVPGIIDFGKAPGYAGTAYEADVRAFSMGFNAGLDSLLNNLRSTNPGIDIMSYSTASLFEKIYANPGDYGFVNTTNACTNITTPMTFAPGCSAAASDWLFWDDVHTTTAGHGVIAASMFNSIYDVPGPLPAAGGVVAFGWARSLRRRQRKALSGRVWMN